MASVAALGHRKIAQRKHFSATLVLHTFRAVEGTFTRIQNVVEAGELGGFGEGGFSLVPDFVGTHALWTPAASALRLSNENKRFCFRCVRLASFSGRVENFTTISSKPKGASASLFASVMTVCKQPVATLGSWIVVVDLTPLASAAAPRSCQNSAAQAFCRDTRLARFPSRGRRSRPLRLQSGLRCRRCGRRPAQSRARASGRASYRKVRNGGTYKTQERFA